MINKNKLRSSLGILSLLLLLLLSNISQFLFWFSVFLSPLVVYERFRLKDIFIKRFFYTYFIFIFWLIFTALISFNLEWPIKRIIPLISCFIIMIYMTLRVDNKEDYLSTMSSILISSFIYSCIVVLFTYKGGYFLDFTSQSLFGKNSSAPVIFMGFFSSTILKHRRTSSNLLVLAQFFFVALLLMTGALKMIIPSLFILLVDMVVPSRWRKAEILGITVKLVLGLIIASLLLKNRLWSDVTELVQIESRVVALFGGEPELSFAKSVTDHREELIGLGYEVFRSNYIFGVGLENTRDIFGTYTHNSIFEVFIGSGILGGVIYIMIHFLWLKEVVRVRSRRLKILVGLFFMSFVFIGSAQRYYDNVILSVLIILQCKAYLLEKNYINGTS